MKSFNYVKKKSPGSFKDGINKVCLEIIYLIDMYKKNLALNNLQWLICHKTKPNQPNFLNINCSFLQISS